LAEGALSRRKQMKATDLLQRDHAAVMTLFAELGRPTTPAGQSRRELIQKLATELEVHAEIEHEIFYPALREIEGAERLVEQAEQEHQEVRDLLAEVLGMDHADEELEARIGDLEAAVLHHATEEEQGMFRRAKELEAGDLERLGEELAYRKRELLQGSRPPAARRAARTGRRGSARAA
jgi:hemerythrin superfamily protein